MKKDVYTNVSGEPLRFVSQVKPDMFGGPGEETFFLVMPGHKIDVTVLGLEKDGKKKSEDTQHVGDKRGLEIAEQLEMSGVPKGTQEWRTFYWGARWADSNPVTNEDT